MTDSEMAFRDDIQPDLRIYRQAGVWHAEHCGAKVMTEDLTDLVRLIKKLEWDR